MSLMKLISLFETLTQAAVKDCFVDNKEVLTFIVAENEMGKAIGKGGSNVHRIEKALNRKIKIVEYNPDLLKFVENAIYPLKARQIVQVDDIVEITPSDHLTRGYLIGRAAVNLHNTEKVVQRFFPIQKIKVL